MSIERQEDSGGGPVEIFNGWLAKASLRRGCYLSKDLREGACHADNEARTPAESAASAKALSELIYCRTVRSACLLGCCEG